MRLTLSAQTLRWLKENAPPLTGARVLVTGATGSLGRYTCAELASLGARLLLPVRNPSKGQALADALRAACPGADVALETADMADFASVDALAARLTAAGEPIDCLVNNAGVFSRAGVKTADGNELHMQVNALGPLRLTRGLLPLMRMAPRPRVVTVTSLAALYARDSAQDPLTVTNATAAYGRSKLALMRGMVAIGREEPGVAFLFAQPGICATDLFRAGEHPTAYGEAFLRVALPLMRHVFMRPEKAALTTAYAACAAADGLRMSEPRGLMGVWGYPALHGVWGKALASALD